MKSTCDNQESAHRKSLSQMLDNMKEIINELEEKENITRRLSAFDSSEMSQLLCDQFVFDCAESKEKSPLDKEMLSCGDNSHSLPPIINCKDVVIPIMLCKQMESATRVLAGNPNLEMEAERPMIALKTEKVVDKEAYHVALSSSIKHTLGRYGEKGFLTQKQSNKKKRSLCFSFPDHLVFMQTKEVG